jgi:chemotaxis protein histidine kinase CheA
MATSAAAGLEALHETRRTRVWTARHCGAAVQAGLDQRFLSIERHLLLAIAADSGRALHYESLYEHAEGRSGRWASTATMGSGSEVSTLDLDLQPKLEHEVWPQHNPEPEPPDIDGPAVQGHDVEGHVVAVVLGAAAAAWAATTGNSRSADAAELAAARELKPIEQELEKRVHELASERSELVALREAHSAERNAWRNERAQGVALIDQLKRDLASVQHSEVMKLRAAAEARAEQAEAVAAAQAQVSVSLRETVKRERRRLASAETKALQYGAEIGQIKAALRRVNKEVQARDEMLAFYEQKLRQKDGQLAVLPSSAPAARTPGRPCSPVAGPPPVTWWPSGRPASPPPQSAAASPQRPSPRQSTGGSRVASITVAATPEHITGSEAELPTALSSARALGGLDISIALEQSERRASALQEEVTHLRRVQQLRAKAMN